jgi:hypothetical protein
LGQPAKPSTAVSTRCSLCKKENIATLNVPKKGAICLGCLKELNLTIESLMGASATPPSNTLPSSASATLPLVPPPHVKTPVADSFTGMPALPDSDVFGSAPPAQLTPWRGSSVPLKRCRRKPSVVGVVLGGMLGIFIALLILHFGFGINLFIPNEKPEPKVNRASARTT